MHRNKWTLSSLRRSLILARLRVYKLLVFLWMMAPRGAKRVFDICFSLLALLMLAPVMALISLAVMLDGGPVLFAQERIGRGGRKFRMYKFRSMCVDAEDRLDEISHLNEKMDGVTFKASNDPRITPVGRILRTTSLDELPQLLNVLAGQMSIVGPRPCLPREAELYQLHHRRRFLVRPGLTCLWQVGERFGGVFEIGNRNSIGFEEQVDLDICYIRKRSFVRDLWIVVKTLPALIMGK